MAHGMVPIKMKEGPTLTIRASVCAYYPGNDFLLSFSFGVCGKGGWPPHQTMANHASSLPDGSLSPGISCHDIISSSEQMAVSSFIQYELKLETWRGRTSPLFFFLFSHQFSTCTSFIITSNRTPHRNSLYLQNSPMLFMSRLSF